MNETTVVNLRKDEYDVYIGRGSKWGNPYPVWLCESREDCLKQYEFYIRHIKHELLDDLHELEGKKLGCFCRPQNCHGDILIKLIKERND